MRGDREVGKRERGETKGDLRDRMKETNRELYECVGERGEEETD